MKKFNFLQIVVFMIALFSLTTQSMAQTTIVLPQACNCPSATDADGDGVPDATDACLGTPSGTTVDATGCPIGNSPSTNGTGVVSSYGAPVCTANTINGTMTAGTAVSGVTMSLYANVTTLGTYNLSATQNGVNFSGSGTFTALGCQLVTLTASGTPTTAGATIWVTNSTPVGIATGTVAAAGPAFPAGYVACNGEVTVVQDVMSATGRLWMDRNLGASRAALTFDDVLAFGDLYQWGRFADGHQCRTSAFTSTLATTAVPNAGNPWDGLVIEGGTNNWLTTNNNTLWQGVNGTNNPCPSGYRLPTIAEWDNERFSWSTVDSYGAFGSPLKFVQASIGGSYISGNYWSSTSSVSGLGPGYVTFHSTASQSGPNDRVNRLSVRCIKN